MVEAYILTVWHRLFFVINNMYITFWIYVSSCAVMSRARKSW